MGEEDGPWIPQMIDNPSPKMIPNPLHKNSESYRPRAIEYVGFEIWSATKGSIFDNIYLGDSIEEANVIAERNWARVRTKELVNRHAQKGGDVHEDDEDEL